MEINPHLSVVNAFIDELCRAGVRHVCISPGSRSTPLTIACARHPDIRVWTLLDERSAGFFAYGLARKTGRPVALVCTSGTATANYLPAVMEAYYSRVPLIVLTADRPAELREVGSNQTVRQTQMYGSHVKWFAEMPVPDSTSAFLYHARAMAARAALMATAAPAGPVHFNWPLREPLLPPLADSGDFTPRITCIQGVPSITSVQAKAFVESVQDKRRGLIVCGPMDDESAAQAVLQLANRLQYPILADPLSQLRALPGDLSLILDRHDTFLRFLPKDGVDWEKLRPDLIIRFGRTPISKVLGQFISSLSGVRQVVVDDSAMWQDPFFTATDCIVSNAEAFCDKIAAIAPHRRHSDWVKSWQRVNEMARGVLEAGMEAIEPMFEGRVFTELARILPDDSTLIVGNSMPVRDLDSFFPKMSRRIRIMANRGASGIDGVVSTALGAAAGNAGPVVLVIGDLSFYHDLNGLLAAKQFALHLIVVLIHNDGGGIFSMLPQSTQEDVFSYFETPHGLDFASAVSMYGGQFRRINSWDEFRAGMAQAHERSGLQVLELRTDRSLNVDLHKQIQSLCASIFE